MKRGVISMKRLKIIVPAIVVLFAIIAVIFVIHLSKQKENDVDKWSNYEVVFEGEEVKVTGGSGSTDDNGRVYNMSAVEMPKLWEGDNVKTVEYKVIEGTGSFGTGRELKVREWKDYKTIIENTSKIMQGDYGGNIILSIYYDYDTAGLPLSNYAEQIQEAVSNIKISVVTTYMDGSVKEEVYVLGFTNENSKSITKLGRLVEKS